MISKGEIMKITRVDLYEYFNLSRPENGAGYLNCFIPENSSEICINRKHPAMIVIPGGGYAARSDRENEPIALQYLANDYCAFTLEYSIAPIRHPYPIIEAAMAVAYVRENAQLFHVKSDNIACVGFSAGGHLCASIGNMFDIPELDVLGNKKALCRPDAIVLGYPVISSIIKKTHRGTFNNLCGEDNVELQRKMSIETHVKSTSAPAFIFHTVTDGAVPVRNSLVLADAYVEAGVPFALHVFEKGEHGLSLANKMVYGLDKFEGKVFSFDFTKWVNLSIKWLEERGFKVLD